MDSEDSVKNVMSHQPHMLTDDQEVCNRVSEFIHNPPTQFIACVKILLL